EFYRPVATSDGNGNTWLTEYDDKHRSVRTYLGGGVPGGGSGYIPYQSIVGQFDPDNVLREVNYPEDNSTFIDGRRDLIYGVFDNPGYVETTYDIIDNLGRPTKFTATYPDATISQNLAYDGLGSITAINKKIDHLGESLEVQETFPTDDVLRPAGHTIKIGDLEANTARNFYNNQDHLLVKLVGQVGQSDRFLQQVDYYYDNIGRLTDINSFGDYECNIGNSICELGLTFVRYDQDFEDKECTRINMVRVNGNAFEYISDASTPEELAADLEVALDAALMDAGYAGTVTVTNYYTVDLGYGFNVTIASTDADNVSIEFRDCAEAEVFTVGDCCTVDPPIFTGGENSDIVGDVVDNPDLYFQKMDYDGIDISTIEIGSECFFGRMVNTYEYDPLHRVTRMDNTFFTPDPVANAFSTKYTYDKVGNILTLSRNGLTGEMADGMPVTGLIDKLSYRYEGGTSSILQGIEDQAPNTDIQPLGFEHLNAGYSYDSNGNMLNAGPVSMQYNPLNLPKSISGPAGDVELLYISTGEKYKKTTSGETEEGLPFGGTRYYLAGTEWEDGKPASYNFGEGRVYWSEDEGEWLPALQYRLKDHLGNAMVFFEDQDEDGLLITEADTDDPDQLEVKQRLWYYPFGMHMEGIGQQVAVPGQVYRYNGKEMEELTGLYDYGLRWYDPEIGRFTGVDPIADNFAWVSPYNYAENEPVGHIDLWGLQKAKYSENETLTDAYFDSEDGTYTVVATPLVKGSVPPNISDARDAGEFYAMAYSMNAYQREAVMTGEDGLTQEQASQLDLEIGKAYVEAGLFLTGEWAAAKLAQGGAWAISAARALWANRVVTAGSRYAAAKGLPLVLREAVKKTLDRPFGGLRKAIKQAIEFNTDNNTHKVLIELRTRLRLIEDDYAKFWLTPEQFVIERTKIVIDFLETIH
ncbi:MAG: RHS repeat-associated core domain-containing protein, partial [Bacteroidota bacterium]